MLTASTRWNLPEGVSFDGPQNFGSTKTLLVFTDYEVSGGTFSLPPCEATPTRLIRETAELRRAFRPPEKTAFAPAPEYRP